jgi:signal transduction histidine kinase
LERTTEINSVLWLGTGMMLFLAFGLIFLVLFYQNYFSRMKRREAEQLLLVSLETEKHERQRIAADLHDSVSGDLVAIRNYLSLLGRPGQASDPSVFEELREGVENALENTRQVSYKLMPPLLNTMGLSAAIADYFERLSSKTAKAFQVEAPEESPNISAETSYELFRVVQELSTNMLKYGSINTCRVRIEESPTIIRLDITDDGVPFDFKASAATAKGTGLHNIESRLKVIGATLEQPTTQNGNHLAIILKKKTDAQSRNS